MLKGRRSGQEKKHSSMRSSSSSSHPRRMLWGRGVTVDVKHGDKPREDVLEVPQLEFGTFEQSGEGYNFFRWCEEEDVQKAGNDEVQKRYDLEVADLEFKVSKLKRKLHEERVIRRLFTAILIVSWALTIGLCIFFSINCVRG